MWSAADRRFLYSLVFFSCCILYECERQNLQPIGPKFTLPSIFFRFINARRRILQPMLDSSCSETPKTKKKTAQNRPVQRFWPDSIASGVAQQQSNELTMSDGEESCLNMDNKINSSLTGKWRVWCLWWEGNLWIFQYQHGFNLGRHNRNVSLFLSLTVFCGLSKGTILEFMLRNLLLFQKFWNDRIKAVKLRCTEFSLCACQESPVGWSSTGLQLQLHGWAAAIPHLPRASSWTGRGRKMSQSLHRLWLKSLPPYQIKQRDWIQER